MRSYRSNEIAVPHQQLSIEEKSTKEDSSLIDIPVTDNQPIPPFSSSKEKKAKFHAHMQSRPVLRGTKGNKAMHCFRDFLRLLKFSRR